MLNGLDLFSGIGGIATALAPWVRPIAYCEIDRYAQAVLVSRMAEGALPLAPIWDDVRTLHRGILAGHTTGQHDDGETIDIITGGFPCQDISVAGTGAGLAGERSGLFYEIARLAGELRPAFLFLENVPAITTRGGREVVGTFTALGYDCRWCVAPSGHGIDGFRGNRWFLLAKAQGARLETGWECGGNKKRQPLFARKVQNVGLDFPRPTVKPAICGIPYGLSYRVDRVKALGNAVVPLQAKKAFKKLIGL